MSSEKVDPSQGEPVVPIENIYDHSSGVFTIGNTSETIEEITGVAIPSNAGLVTITPHDGFVNYNPAAGDATVANGRLPKGLPYPCWGSKAKLDDITLFSADDGEVTIIVAKASL